MIIYWWRLGKNSGIITLMIWSNELFSMLVTRSTSSSIVTIIYSKEQDSGYLVMDNTTSRIERYSHSETWMALFNCIYNLSALAIYLLIGKYKIHRAITGFPFWFHILWWNKSQKRGSCCWLYSNKQSWMVRHRTADSCTSDACAEWYTSKLYCTSFWANNSSGRSNWLGSNSSFPCRWTEDPSRDPPTGNRCFLLTTWSSPERRLLDDRWRSSCLPTSLAHWCIREVCTMGICKWIIWRLSIVVGHWMWMLLFNNDYWKVHGIENKRERSRGQEYTFILHFSINWWILSVSRLNKAILLLQLEWFLFSGLFG